VLLCKGRSLVHTMATNETGDTATTTMTTTAAAPSPCPVIPKSAMEIAAIIASTKITPMGHQHQQQRSFPPPPGTAPGIATAPAPVPTFILVAPPPPNLPASAAITLSLSQSLSMSKSKSHPEKQKQQQQPMQRRPFTSQPQIQQSTTQKIAPPITVTTATTVTAITPTVPTKKPITINTTIKKSNSDNKKKNDAFVLRSGKWTPEEEMYANILIEFFEAGEVDEFEHHLNIHNHNNNNHNNNNNNNKVGEQQQQQSQTHLKTTITNGMTLRSYLSRKLFCSPMRISKKFAGKGIGKRVYMSQNPSNLFHHQHFPHFSPNITGLTYNNNNTNSTTITSGGGVGGTTSSVLPYPQHPYPTFGGGGGPSLLPSSSISSSSSSCSPESNVKQLGKKNRLNVSVTKFLKVAFPHGDPTEAASNHFKLLYIYV
jgi:hypothetical protein